MRYFSKILILQFLKFKIIKTDILLLNNEKLINLLLVSLQKMIRKLILNYFINIRVVEVET
jgi:hypothetical protein